MALKITGGTHRGRPIKLPKDKRIRPTSSMVREALFNIIQPRLAHIDTFLDIFSGTGIVGIEALSRGIPHVVFIEKEQKTCTTLLENLILLGLEKRGKVCCREAIYWLERGKYKALGSHILFFMDPPYSIPTLYTQALYALQRSDFKETLVVQHPPDWIPPSGWVMERSYPYGSTVLSFLCLS